MKIRKYSELKHLKTFDERFEYLKLNDGIIGDSTFGSHRYLNQNLYRSKEWKRIRDKVILRDNGCDLGIDGYEIHTGIIIHHMIPITIDDILEKHDIVFNTDYLICTSLNTHNAIHFGNESILPPLVIERKPGDTTLWKRKE